MFMIALLVETNRKHKDFTVPPPKFFNYVKLNTSLLPLIHAQP